MLPVLGLANEPCNGFQVWLFLAFFARLGAWLEGPA